MLIDRGMKKWNTMMLPEHVARLNAWAQEQQLEKSPKPLTEWQLTELEETVKTAYEQKLSISFTKFEMEKWQTVTGIIQQINLNKNIIILKTMKGNLKIPFTTIQGAETDDSFR